MEPGEAALEGLDQSPARLDGAELGLDLLWMGSQSAWFGLSSVCAFCMQLLLPIWGFQGGSPGHQGFTFKPHLPHRPLLHSPYPDPGPLFPIMAAWGCSK